MLSENNRIFINYKKDGFKSNDKLRLDSYSDE